MTLTAGTAFLKFDRIITSDDDPDVDYDVMTDVEATAEPSHASAAPVETNRSAREGQVKPVDLRTVLRDRTDRDHRDLDALVGEIWHTPDDYAAYILMNQRAHHIVEPRIEAALRRHGVAVDYRAMRHALDRDLKAIGVQPLAEEAPFLPELGDIPALVGAVYVLEGSRLGARLLHRKVAASTWIETFGTRPLMFFEAALASENFSQRMDVLGGLMTNRDDLESAVQAAGDLFALFKGTAEQAKIRHTMRHKERR